MHENKMEAAVVCMDYGWRAGVRVVGGLDKVSGKPLLSLHSLPEHLATLACLQ